MTSPSSVDEAVSAGLEIGRSVFEVSIDYKVDDTIDSVNPSYYDFAKDLAVLYRKAIDFAASRGLNSSDLIKYSSAHECGHAREARIFAKEGIFPWQLMWPEVPTIIVSGIRTKAKLLKQYLTPLLIYFQDFAIDHSLSKLGLKDPYAKLRIIELQNVSEENDSLSRLDVLLNLPHDIAFAEHGDISDKEKKTLRGYADPLVGPDKWTEAHELMSQREFGDCQGYIKLVQNYFSSFLNIETDLVLASKTELGDLPSFWELEKYSLLRIKPSKM